MAFNNNQGFPRQQFQNQNFLQPQQLANIRLQGSGNISPGAQNVFSTLQGTVAAGGIPWGTGLAVQAGQHAMQTQTLAAGFQGMPNQPQQQNAAKLMGMFANQQMLAQAAGNPQLLAQIANSQQLLQQSAGNQQLYAQAAGLMANPGLGLQMPVGGAGILGAGPVGQMMQNIQLGNPGQFSPIGANQMQHNRSRDNKSGSRERKFDKSRGDSRDNRDFRRDRNPRGDSRSGSGDRSDSKNSDGSDNRRRRNDRGPREEVRRGDSERRSDRGSDRRREDQDRGSDRRREDQRKTGRGRDRDSRNRDTGSRTRDNDSKSRREQDKTSPDRKRQRVQDEEASRKPRYDESETEEIEEWPEEEVPAWIRCSPADLYFTRDSKIIETTTLVYACIGGKELIDCLNCDEFHLIPGATISMLCAEALQRVGEIPGHKTVYILGGIADLLTTLASADGYRETIFEDNGLYARFCEQLLIAETNFKSMNCHVVFCTIASMSLHIYNGRNIQDGTSTSLKFQQMYPDMQFRLHLMIKEINSFICSLNNGQKLLTPLVHSYINKRSSRKEKTIYRLNKLEDGLNPSSSVIRSWIRTMNKIIYRNQKILSGPEFDIPLCKIEPIKKDEHWGNSRERSREHNRDRESGRDSDRHWKERHHSLDSNKDRDRNRHGSRDRDSNLHGSRDRDRNRHGSRDRDSNLHGSRDRDRNRHGSRDRDRNRHGSRDRDRNRHGSRDRDRSRLGSRDRDTIRHESRDLDRNRRDRDRNHDRNKDLDRKRYSNR